MFVKTAYHWDEKLYKIARMLALHTLLHEIFTTPYFREFCDFKKSRNLVDAKNKCREDNMTQKLSDTLGKSQERISLVY